MHPELTEKTERLSTMLGRTGFDGIFLTLQRNFAWLTGGGSNGVDLSSEAGASTLFVTKDSRRFVVANAIEMPRLLAEEVTADDFEPVSFPWQAGGEVFAEKAREILGASAKLAGDTWMPDVTPIEHEVGPCRFELTHDEAGRYRQLGHDAGTVMRRAIDTLKPGETELAIAEKVRHHLALAGMDSIVTLVAADERIKQFRHPIPTENHWERTLLLVTCAKRGGLVASLSRMLCLGDVPAELRERTEAAAYINARLLHATRAGASASELYGVAETAYAAVGFADEINKHHQGGAAGYKPREWVAHPNGGDIVQSDQAFAWNPSITGTKVEETCILSDGKIEIITASPDFPTIATSVDGTEYISPGILSI